MTYDMQYFFDYDKLYYPFDIVINKNQTLLALNFGFYTIDIFSMETGTHISRYG
jgi:hypothetical protein